MKRLALRHQQIEDDISLDAGRLFISSVEGTIVANTSDAVDPRYFLMISRRVSA